MADFLELPCIQGQSRFLNLEHLVSADFGIEPEAGRLVVHCRFAAPTGTTNALVLRGEPAVVLHQALKDRSAGNQRFGLAEPLVAESDCCRLQDGRHNQGYPLPTYERGWEAGTA